MPKMTAEQKFQHWADHVAAWKASDLSQVGYCKQNNISYDQFNYQYNRFHKSPPNPDNSVAKDKQSDFITLSVKPSVQEEATTTHFTIRHANGAVFQWSAPWGPKEVACFVEHWGGSA